MGGSVSLGGSTVVHLEGVHDKPREPATDDTRAAAEADAQAWATSYVDTHGRITPDKARELRARVQRFANERNQQISENNLDAIMTRVLDRLPARSEANDPDVRAAAAEPLPADPAVAHDGPPNPGDPRPDDPNVPTRDLPNSPGADYSRLMKGGTNPNPNPNAPPNPAVAAAFVPPGVAPPPPLPGVAVPPPLGVPSDDRPPPSPGSPLLAGSPPPPGSPLVPGAPIVPGTPVIPSGVPGEPPVLTRVLSLGEPVRGLLEGEHEDQTNTFMTMRSGFNQLTSTVRPGTPAPLPTLANAGETIGSRLRSVASRPVSSRSGKSGSGGGGRTEGRGGEDMDRTLALGIRRGALGSAC